MKSSSDSLLRSKFTRRTATVTISAPLASIARAVSSPDLYLPVPTINRDRNCRPARNNGSIVFIVKRRAHHVLNWSLKNDTESEWGAPPFTFFCKGWDFGDENINLFDMCKT